MPNDANRITLQIAQELIDTGEECSLAELKLRLRPALEPFQDEMFAALIDKQAKYADDRLKKPPKQKQLQLFDTDGWYPLGDDRRIGKRYARLEHLQEHLAIVDQDYERKKASRDRQWEEFERLKPYLARGLAKWQAVEEYLKANPEAQSA